MNKLKLLRNDDIHFQLVEGEGIGGDENGSFQNQHQGEATASRLSRAASKKTSYAWQELGKRKKST